MSKKIDRVKQTDATLEKWRKVCESDEAIPLVMFNQSVTQKGKHCISLEDDLPKEMIIDGVIGCFMVIPEWEEPFLKSVAELLGATGKFPAGKLAKDDDGQLRFAIGIDKTRVIMDFGKKTSWLGMEPADAIRIGKALIEKANTITN